MDFGRYISARAVDRDTCGSSGASVPPASRDPGPVEHQPGHAVSARGPPWKEPASWGGDRLLPEATCAECAAADFRCQEEPGPFLLERPDGGARAAFAAHACILGAAVATNADRGGRAPRELGHALPHATGIVL